MELLREYAAEKSEQAFAAIVSRHLNLVYSVALRHAGNAHEAQDITQAVFVVLARKAGSLRKGTVLSGWLFHAARMTASNFIRSETRRTKREQEAYMQSTLTEEPANDDWKQIAPLLDTAMADLGEQDRNAIVLRYVEGKDLKAVGVALGSSEEAAKKRVSRAVEKLRGFFTKRGVVLSSAALAGAISANAVQAAPAGLAAVITAGAMEGAAATVSSLTLMKGALKLMAWTKVKIAVGLGVAALVAYQWHQNDVQTKQIAALQGELQQSAAEAEKQRAALEKLKQQRQAMVDEKAAAEKASAKLMAHQRAALTASAKNAASGSNSPGSALGKLMDDPAMKEFMKQQQLTTLKKQYAPLVKSLNLTPGAADQFMQLLGDDAMKKMDVGMSVMKGELDAATAKQMMTGQKDELVGQLQSLLGTDGYAQYQQFAEDVPTRTMVDLIKQQMADTPLSDDQSARLFALMKAVPKQADSDQLILTSAQQMEQYMQQAADNNQRVLQQAADFLSPEQLATLGAFQTNMINMQKMGVSMKQRFSAGQ